MTILAQKMSFTLSFHGAFTYNLTNILQAAFVPISVCQKNTNRTLSREKLLKMLSYEKAARKMLVKLTPSYAIGKQIRTISL